MSQDDLNLAEPMIKSKCYDLTAQQEDMICEPTKKCDFCRKSFPKDDIVSQKIDNGEVVEICEGCLEDLEDNNNTDYLENDFEAGVSERKSEGMF